VGSRQGQMGTDLLHGPLLACALCGGTVDDVFMVLGSSVGLTGLAIGFEAAFQKASRVFGWQLADGISDDAADGELAEKSLHTTDTNAGRG